jgi:hypothetical protein
MTFHSQRLGYGEYVGGKPDLDVDTIRGQQALMWLDGVQTLLANDQPPPPKKPKEGPGRCPPGRYPKHPGQRPPTPPNNKRKRSNTN